MPSLAGRVVSTLEAKYDNKQEDESKHASTGERREEIVDSKRGAIYWRVFNLFCPSRVQSLSKLDPLSNLSSLSESD